MWCICISGRVMLIDFSFISVSSLRGSWYFAVWLTTANHHIIYHFSQKWAGTKLHIFQRHTVQNVRIIHSKMILLLPSVICGAAMLTGIKRENWQWWCGIQCGMTISNFMKICHLVQTLSLSCADTLIPQLLLLLAVK